MALSKADHRTFRIAEGQVGWIDLGRAKGRMLITYKHSTFQAVQIDERRMAGAVMVRLQYEDQNFALHATPWERFYAQPLLKNGRPFIPIVTKSGLIVGHCGRVAGSTIWSKDAIPSELKWETWEDFEQSNTVAYYARVTQREADAWRRAGRTSFDREVLYTIVCAIDGQVLQILDVSAVGEIESEGLGPLELVYDIITGAYAVKSLVKGLLRRLLVVGSKQGLKSLIRRISAAVRRKILRRPSDALADEIRRKYGKVGVNLGGTGEVDKYININNLTGGQKSHGIPHLIKGNAEDVASLFSPGTIDDVIANNIVVSDTWDWVRVAKGSHTVLKRGGKVSFTEFGGGTLEIQAALKAAGFKDVEIVAKALVTGVKR